MPRLLGVDIPGDKRVEASLPYIYGIGPKTAKRVLEQANVDVNIRAKDLTPTQIGDIISAITASKLPIEGDLRREIQGNLKRLQAINCYRGIRHRRGLPVRGQRTSTNARTRKGPRKTVGVAARQGREEVTLPSSPLFRRTIVWPKKRTNPPKRQRPASSRSCDGANRRFLPEATAVAPRPPRPPPRRLRARRLQEGSRPRSRG